MKLTPLRIILIGAIALILASCEDDTGIDDIRKATDTIRHNTMIMKHLHLVSDQQNAKLDILKVKGLSLIDQLENKITLKRRKQIWDSCGRAYDSVSIIIGYLEKNPGLVNPYSWSNTEHSHKNK